MRRIDRQIALALALTALALWPNAACKREQRGFHQPPPAVEISANVPYENRVRPGPIAQGTESTAQPIDLSSVLQEPYGTQYTSNAQALSEGAQLYSAFNCVGCHAHGGGGIAPPLMDDKWLYGAEPQQVYLSILEGRANGMPSFRGRVADYQIWELVAYVRSLSGLASPNAASGREEHMSGALPPNSTPAQTPKMQVAPTTGPATGGVAK